MPEWIPIGRHLATNGSEVKCTHTSWTIGRIVWVQEEPLFEAAEVRFSLTAESATDLAGYLKTRNAAGGPA